MVAFLELHCTAPLEFLQGTQVSFCGCASSHVCHLGDSTVREVFSTFSTRGSSLTLVGLTLSIVTGGQASSWVVVGTWLVALGGDFPQPKGVVWGSFMGCVGFFST